jgi:fibronectin type 3 domain-containing protein
MKKLIPLIPCAVLAACSVASSATLSATLTWTAPTTNADGTPISGALTYDVYQGASGAETKVASGVTGTTWAASTGLVAGATVCWKVTAVNAAGVEGGASNEACKSFPETPSAPTNLTVQ